jgi:pSer/pThr/pTyr-binding forkhead associated (FHA) protein
VPRVSRPHVALRFDTGTVVRATELMLVGRDPSPAADEAAAVLVPLPDPDRSVSKTHLTVGVEGDRLWIVDRGSTNGTVVVHQDGVERIVAPGERVDVPFGASVRMGRRDFTVARADV